MLYVCKCGLVRVCGDWQWKYVAFSSFVKRVYKFEVSDIEFYFTECPYCAAKRIAKNHKT